MNIEYITGIEALMNDLLNLQITIFILIFIGFFLRRIGMVGKEGQKNITDIVVNVILPCNIITSFLTAVDSSILYSCLSIFLISVGIQIFCVIYGRLVYKKAEDKKRQCLQYGIICSNGGFLGSPIAEGAYGSLGLMYASVYLIPLRIMMWSEGIAVFSGEKSMKATMKKVIKHPCIIACVFGVVLMLTGFELPAVILTPIQTLGRCNTGCSMLVIGMILGTIDLKTVVDKTVIKYTISRLVIIPVLVYVACTLLGTDEVVRGVSVLLAAMPAGATTSMLAAKYDCAPEFATKLVVFSTLCSIPALMLWCMVL